MAPQDPTADQLRPGIEEIPMQGVRGSEDGTPELARVDGRWVARAYNQGGYDCTELDVADLVAWLRENMPELLT